MTRKILYAFLALASLGLAGVVLVEAVITEHLTQQVLYGVLPLLFLGSVAINALRKPRD